MLFLINEETILVLSKAQVKHRSFMLGV